MDVVQNDEAFCVNEGMAEQPVPGRQPVGPFPSEGWTPPVSWGLPREVSANHPGPRHLPGGLAAAWVSRH